VKDVTERGVPRRGERAGTDGARLVVDVEADETLVVEGVAGIGFRPASAGWSGGGWSDGVFADDVAERGVAGGSGMDEDDLEKREANSGAGFCSGLGDLARGR
jgi:hypothetical protein